MGIEGYVGRPGSGKSYTLTERALSEAAKGRIVFANYVIDHENCYYFHPAQLMDLPPGVIVIDEAHLWFPSRMSLKLPPSWLAMLSQTRKNGWDLLWASQHESRIDRIVRDNTSWMWLCSAWLSVGDHPAFFVSKSYEPEYFRKPGKMMTRRVRAFNPRIAQAYDTFERLVVAEHATRTDDVYAAQSTGGATRSGPRVKKAGASVLDDTLGVG